ncbi:hypothetical protein A2U01_0058840 [Trifolium medium]|uniref:Uncharacterized protein n=1 Tax=Trifolium medium TaxID=97028 RepID=A0A392RPY7_9FABA|nr:hypothetical protein [Trifolium medium]
MQVLPPVRRAGVGGTLRHDTEQVWKSLSQLRAAQEGWRVALASAEELGSFCHLCVAQERTARRTSQLDHASGRFVQGRFAQMHPARRVPSSVISARRADRVARRAGAKTI